MAFTFTELVASIQVRGAESAHLRIRQLQDDVRSLGMTINTVASLGGALLLFRGLQDAARSLGAVSGVSISAQVTGLQAMLRAIAGSNKEARELYRSMEDLSRRTPFNVQDLTEFAARMAATGVSLERIPKDLEKIANMIAYTGVRATDLAPFLFNLLQIRSMKGVIADFTDIREMMQRAPGVARILSTGLGITTDDLLKYLRKGGFPAGTPGVNAEGKITGDAIYEALLRGADKIASGFSERMLRENPTYLAAKIVTSAVMAFESTGRALLHVLMPIGLLARYSLDAFGALNRLSGGVAGLALLFGGAVWLATNQLTQSLFELILALKVTAVAAHQLAVVQGGSAATGAAASAAGAVGGAAVDFAAQIATMEADLSRKRAEYEDLKKAAASRAGVVTQLKGEHGVVAAEGTRLTGTLAALQAEMAQQRAVVEQMGGKKAPVHEKQKLIDLQKRHAVLAERFAAVNARAAELVTQMTTLNAQHNEMTQKMAGARKEVERMSRALEHLQQRAAKAASAAAEGAAVAAGAAAVTTPRSVVKEFLAGLFLGIATTIGNWGKSLVDAIGQFFSRFGKIPGALRLGGWMGRLVQSVTGFLASLFAGIGAWIAAPNLISRILRGGLKIFGIAGVGTVISNLVRGDAKNPVRDLLGNIIEGASWGLALTAFAPHPLIKLGGAALGAAGGAIKWWFDNPDEKAEKETARNTARMAQSLDQLKAAFMAWGGGPRTGMVVTDYQVQWQVAKALGI
ncbi:MAG: tape measure protein [Chloroherpetonaceae bacterium]|nr:tape measure protein [Chloroherpetonaceae bacterium]